MLSVKPVSNMEVKSSPRKTVNVFPNDVKKQDNFEKSGASVGKKVGITAGILATLGAVAAIVISKGKALKNKKILSEIPQDLQARFAKIKNLDGETFSHKAYDEIVDYMGLKGVAPKKIRFDGDASFGQIQGGYSPIGNTIVFTNNFINASKSAQINLISHELTHCRQFTNMLRTEGVSVERYVDAEVSGIIENLKKNNFSFRFGYSQAKHQGRGDEYLENARKVYTEAAMKDVNNNFADILKMPKFKADSPEGLKALQDLEASAKYEGFDLLGLPTEAYKSNPLEVEAYAYGDKMAELFKKFVSIK